MFKMLYELKLRNLAKSIYLAFNDMLDESNMVLHEGDIIKETIFFKRIFSKVNEKNTEQEILKKIKEVINSNESMKYYFARELSLDQKKFNYITYSEYRSLLKKRKLKKVPK